MKLLHSGCGFCQVLARAWFDDQHIRYPNQQYIYLHMDVSRGLYLLEPETSTSPRNFQPPYLASRSSSLLMTLITLFFGFMLVVEAFTVRERSPVVCQMHAIRISI